MIFTNIRSGVGVLSFVTEFYGKDETKFPETTERRLTAKACAGKPVRNFGVASLEPSTSYCLLHSRFSAGCKKPRPATAVSGVHFENLMRQHKVIACAPCCMRRLLLSP